MIPKIIKGNCHKDSRGLLFFNNDFDISSVKRMYFIENTNSEFVRAWQGHKIERRWFSAIVGSFSIELIAINHFNIQSSAVARFKFVLNSGTLDVLHIPAGYVSSIQSLEEDAKLLVMADYRMGELDDEYRFAIDYFK